MPKPILLILVLILVLAGLAFWLSGRASDVPTSPVEIEVNTPADAG